MSKISKQLGALSMHVWDRFTESISIIVTKNKHDKLLGAVDLPSALCSGAPF